MDNWLITKQFPTQLVSASGFVYKDDKILMVKSKRRGWEFPGGISEKGEAIIDCLKREIFEESGIKVEAQTLIGVYQRLNLKKGHGPLEGEMLPAVTVFTFKCKYIDGIEKTSDESEEVKWFNIKEIDKIITNSYVRKTYEDLIKYDGRIVFSSFETTNEEIEMKSEDII